MIYIAFLLFTFIILLFAFYQWQYFMIFSPTYIQERRLCDACQALEVVTDDGVALEGVVYEPKEFLSTILFFGGRSQDSVALIQKLQSTYPKSRIITFNYRSYGRNKGKINEANMFLDALYIAKIVQKNYGDFYLLGYSLGSSVASYVASKLKIKALFLVGAFDSIYWMAKKRLGLAIPNRLIRYKFPTSDYVKEVDADTYLFVSKDDETTYIENGRALSKKIKNLLLYKEYTKLSHDDLLWDNAIVQKINGIINR